MKNQIQAGVNITIPAPAALKSGDPVLLNKLFGIAAEDAAQNAPVEIVTLGVFAMRKSGGEDFEVGDPVYYNDSLKLAVQNEAAGAVRIGVATRVASASAVTVEVRLDGVMA